MASVRPSPPASPLFPTPPPPSSTTPRTLSSSPLPCGQFKAVPGLFDFFYLPMDFKNKCNVGYAFINIREQAKVPIFYDALQGKKWDCFNSEKCCELNYGRIQGIDNLLLNFAHTSLVQ